MRSASRHSYRLPLALSLVVHGVLLGGLLAVSGGSAATPAPGIDTRSVDGSSGWIVQILPEKAETLPAKPATKQRPASGPIDEYVRVDDPPVRPENAKPVPGPVVKDGPGAPGGAPPSAAKTGNGGAGSGNGSGSMFAPAPTAKSVVYVLDRSGSMGQADAYRRACGAVLANLAQWPATTQFQVVAYNSKAQPLCVNASLGLLPNNTDTLQKVAVLLAALPPTGWTDHRCGLRCGLLLAPDVLYLVTDADDLTAEDVRWITNLNRGRTVIHTIEMHSRHSARATGALAQLASGNKGTYRKVLLED
jgi:hypothetical protein